MQCKYGNDDGMKKIIASLKIIVCRGKKRTRRTDQCVNAKTKNAKNKKN